MRTIFSPVYYKSRGERCSEIKNIEILFVGKPWEITASIACCNSSVIIYNLSIFDDAHSRLF